MSRVLTESCFGSFFSHFGFWVTSVAAEKERRSIAIGLHVLVLDFSTSSTQNLFTGDNQSILFAGCTMQNSPLPEGSCKGDWSRVDSRRILDNTASPKYVTTHLQKNP